MRNQRFPILVFTATTLGLSTFFIGDARAADEPKPVMSTRGGVISTTPAGHQFEVFFYPTGLRVFPKDWKTGAVISQWTGTATVNVPNAPKPFVYALKGAPAKDGREPGSLDLSVDLSKVPEAGSTVAFAIEHLGDPAEDTAKFTSPIVFVKTKTTAPMSMPKPPEVNPRVGRPTGALLPAAGNVISVSGSGKADQAAIKAQGVCPISGAGLGSMGAPIKVSRGSKDVYICCKNCLAKIQANPDAYFAR